MTKTQLFAKSEKELSPYFAVYREILTATGWRGWEQVKVKNSQDKLVPTGETVEVVYPFSCEDKLLWCWMLDRYQFFKEGKNVWFDNQDEIAAYTGISVSTVKRFIKKLSVSGVLVIKAKPMGGARFSNSYVITKDLHLVQRENIVKKASVMAQVERSEQTNANPQPDEYDEYSGVLTQDKHNDAEYVEPELANEAWVNESVPEYDDSYTVEKWSESIDIEVAPAPVEQTEESNIFESDEFLASTVSDEPKMIVFESIYHFINTDFKQWTTEEAIKILEANGVQNATKASLKGHGACKWRNDWFDFDPQSYKFVKNDLPY